MPIEATLCYVLRDGEVLLIEKARGFGKGKWNAPGGKLRPMENPTQCAVREVFEETGLRVSGIRLLGTLRFYFGQREAPDWVVYVFVAWSFTGELKTSGEGAGKWFRREEIPYDEMWADDRHWVPVLLQGNRFRGDFYFDDDGTNLLDYGLETEDGTTSRGRSYGLRSYQ